MKIDRILANNPGPFTGPGTNTWVLDDGSGITLVIDPGPVDPDHEAAIIERLDGRKVSAVLVTHTHPDHAPMANPLARNLGVGAYGHGPGPEFSPDQVLSDGDSLAFGSGHLEIISTPGHSDDHLCFRSGDVLFTGDHIMGGSSVMVERMGPYLSSLRKLQGTGLRRLLPGHGEEMDDPEGVIDWYLAHRLQRHGQILESVDSGARSVSEVVEDVYSDVDKSLYPLAARSVRAHLALLCDEGRIALAGDAITVLPPNSP
jgi:glyoxylase-like metal-dependent hydrolase (beta-lactamase superfamily II)